MRAEHDYYDQMILDSILWDARKSYSDIAAEIGISRTTVKKRMDSMVATGIIRGFHTIISQEMKEDGMEFFLEITLKPEKALSVLNNLKKYESFRKIFLVSGRGKVIVWGRTTNSITMESIVSYLERTATDIEEIEWTTVLTEVKTDSIPEQFLKGEERWLEGVIRN